MRLLVIGFDGLDHEVHKHTRLEWKSQPLESLYMSSGPCWVTIYTGAPRQAHGIGQVVGVRSDGTLAWPDLALPCIWDVLADEGYSVALCNLPITNPPKKVNGWMVAGYPLWERPYGCGIEAPRNWFRWADINYHRQLPDKDAGGYTFDDVNLGYFTPFSWAETLEMGYRRSNRVLTWFALHAIDADFGFVAFTWVDRLGHLKAIKKSQAHLVSGYVDKQVDALLRVLKPEKVLLISDHGLRVREHTPQGAVSAIDIDITGVEHIGDVAPIMAREFDCLMPIYDEPFVADPPSEVQRRLEGWGYMT